MLQGFTDELCYVAWVVWMGDGKTKPGSCIPAFVQISRSGQARRRFKMIVVAWFLFQGAIRARPGDLISRPSSYKTHLFRA